MVDSVAPDGSPRRRTHRDSAEREADGHTRKNGETQSSGKAREFPAETRAVNPVVGLLLLAVLCVGVATLAGVVVFGL